MDLKQAVKIAQEMGYQHGERARYKITILPKEEQSSTTKININSNSIIVL